MHTSISPAQTIRQLAQLAVFIQGAASELSGYEMFFGAENVSYIREGAGRMVRLVGEALGASQEKGPGMNKEQRHDLRNHVAVVKGFSDLILMDLPAEHSARYQLEELSRKCMEFVRMLDEHRALTAESGPATRAMAS